MQHKAVDNASQKARCHRFLCVRFRALSAGQKWANYCHCGVFIPDISFVIRIQTGNSDTKNPWSQGTYLEDFQTTEWPPTHFTFCVSHQVPVLLPLTIMSGYGQPANLYPTVTYVCGQCRSENELKPGDAIACRDCGYRILYKKRTKRVVQFEARWSALTREHTTKERSSFDSAVSVADPSGWALSDLFHERTGPGGTAWVVSDALQNLVVNLECVSWRSKRGGTMPVVRVAKSCHRISTIICVHT